MDKQELSFGWEALTGGDIDGVLCNTRTIGMDKFGHEGRLPSAGQEDTGEACGERETIIVLKAHMSNSIRTLVMVANETYCPFAEMIVHVVKMKPNHSKLICIKGLIS